MSHRNRDDREYDDRQAQQNRQQSYSPQQGQYGRQHGNEADDRDVQGNFSSGGQGSQSYRGHGSSQGSVGGSSYESGYGSGGHETQGYGLQGYGSEGSQGYGPQSYAAPSTGAGSQGFGPEGYGTSMYEGRGGYEPQFAQGNPGWRQQQGSYGRDIGQHEFGSQGMDRPSRSQYQGGHDMGSSSQGSQRYPYGYGELGGRESSGSQQWGGQRWRNPYEERSQSGYDLDDGQSLSSQNLHGRQGQGYPSSQGLRSSHRGLGPRNYTRSDERIREDLNERLTDADDIDARGLTVEVSNGVATLKGTVEQRWMKHRAEDLAESCSGVRDVNNQIRVQSQQESTIGSQGGSRNPGNESASSLSGTATTPSASATSGSGGAGPGSSPGSSGMGSSGSSTTRTGGSTSSGH